MINQRIKKDAERFSDDKKLELIGYLKSTVQLLSDKETYQEAIYEIAGLMSLDYVRSLPNDDKLIEIMSIAGQLEVPADFTDSKLQHLVKLIKELKVSA